MKNLIILTYLLVGYDDVCIASTAYLDKVFTKVSIEQNVPSGLLRAICWAESNHKIDSLAVSDGGGANHSFGVCQVLHSTAKDFGFSDDNCGRKTIEGRSRKDCGLFDPYINITYAAKVLKHLMKRYNGDWINSVAAYNTGSIKICTTGKVTRKKDKKVIYSCIIGGYMNQKYITRVLQALEEGR